MPRKLTDIPDWFWLALAYLVRAGFILGLGGGLHQADENGVDAAARVLAHTGSLLNQDRPWIMTPFPTAFFAAVYRVFGDHPTAARLAQAVVATVFVKLMSKFVGQVTESQKNGKLALALASVYPFFIYYSGMLMSETLYLLGAVAGLWWLYKSLYDRGVSTRLPILAGLSMGFAGLCRAEGAVIFAVILACCTIAVLKGRWRAGAWALTVFFWLVLILGWTARNRVKGGHWILDEHAGSSLLHGTVVFEQNEADTSQAMEALHRMPFWQEGWKMPEHEREAYFTRVAVDYMREDPGRTARQWARKFVNFWRFYPRQDKRYSDVAGNNPAAGMSRRLLVAASLLFEPALILGGFGGLWTLRKRWRELFPLGLFLVGTMVAHVVSVSQMRYRLPVMPILILGFCTWLGNQKRIKI